MSAPMQPATPRRPVRLEEMHAHVDGLRRGRLAMRREMIDCGHLREPLQDRTIEVQEKLCDLLAKIMVRRAEVAKLLRDVVVAPAGETPL